MSEAKANYKCLECGKDMSPVERIMGAVCGKCVRKLHKKAVGGKR